MQKLQEIGISCKINLRKERGIGKERMATHFLRKFQAKMNDWYLKKQLLIIYMICGILPIALVSALLIGLTYSRLIRFTDSQLQSDNQTNRAVVLNTTNLATAISKIIASSEQLEYMIITEFEEEKEVYKAYRSFELLHAFENNYPEIADIQVYINNPTLVSTDKFRFMKDAPLVEAWRQDEEQNVGEVTWISGHFFSTDATLYLVRPIYYPQSDYYAILAIGISNNYLNSMNQYSNQTTLVSLSQQEIFYSNNSSMIGLDFLFESRHSLLGCEGSLCRHQGRWVLAYESKVDAFSSTQSFEIVTISNDNRQIVGILILICLIVLFVVCVPILIFIAFSNYYSSRLQLVREEMHKISKGDLELVNQCIGKDELGELFHDMQKTITDIQLLHTRIMTAQKEKDMLELHQQQMQFEMLASQINPHFLFNTLETIRMQAVVTGQEEIAMLVMSLGKTLRYALDTQASTTTLAADIESVKSYLEIQHFRFRDKVNYSISIHPNLKPEQIEILPFLIQPIVENCVIHGFKTKKKGGTIQITVIVRSEILMITVSDNGCGIAEDVLARIHADMEQDQEEKNATHIGINNVNSRIKLYYGAEYGIHMSSTLGEGTTTTIKIPYKEH